MAKMLIFTVLSPFVSELTLPAHLAFSLPYGNKVYQHIEPRVLQHLIKLFLVQFFRMPSTPMLDLHEDGDGL
jgi:hypothetical protein